jgi:hypothetical protein
MVWTWKASDMAPNITRYDNYAFFFLGNCIKDNTPLDWQGRQTDHMDLHKKVTTTFYILCGKKMHIGFTLHEPLAAMMLNFFGFSANFG